MTPKPHTDDQAERFKQAARELGTDERDDALDRAFGKLDVKRKPEKENGKGKTEK